MKKRIYYLGVLPAFFFAGSMALTSCSTDDNIDIDDVDATIGVKLDKFTVPLGQTKKDITLGDVLDLKEDDCIKLIKKDASGKYIEDDGKRIALTSGNEGDYIFYKKGDDIDPAKPEVDPLEFKVDASKDKDFSFTFKLYSLKDKDAPIDPDKLEKSDKIKTFVFNGSKDEMVLDLKHAVANTDVKFALDFKDLKDAGVNYVKTIEFDLPDFMEMELKSGLSNVGAGSGWNPATHQLILIDVPTDERRTIRMELTGLTNFKKSIAEIADPTKDDYLLLNETDLDMQGNVNMKIKLDLNQITYPTVEKDCNIGATVTLGDVITITEATGHFDPDIDIDDSDVKITDVPDFLDDPEVNITLNDPQITLTISSDIDVDAYIDGILTSYFSDKTTKVVTINNIEIPRNQNSKILICRQPKAEPYMDYTKVYAVSNLSDLIERIPDKITFKANARANKENLGTVVLGKTYNISTGYNINAPLALDGGSKIVYDDKTDGFYEDIEDNDIDFRGKTTLEITGKATNNTPLSLTIDPTAIDVNGNPISGIKLTSVNEITANGTSDILIKVEKDANTDLKAVKFDGIKFKAHATSANATTLNKNTHTIKIENLKVNISGELSIDADSKKK